MSSTFYGHVSCHLQETFPPTPFAWPLPGCRQPQVQLGAGHSSGRAWLAITVVEDSTALSTVTERGAGMAARLPHNAYQRVKARAVLR